MYKDHNKGKVVWTFDDKDEMLCVVEGEEEPKSFVVDKAEAVIGEQHPCAYVPHCSA